VSSGAPGAPGAPRREAPSGWRGPLPAFAAHPRVAALVAAGGLSATGLLFVLSGTAPSTATLFRCLYALPVLWLLTRSEESGSGRRPWSSRRWAFLAGVSFAADLLLFHHSILLLGAGLATVLSNLQVVLVPLAAWGIWGERPTRLQAAAIPIALAGIVLISGVVGGDAYGEDPVLGVILGLGVAATYAAYLLLLRKGRDQAHAAGPIQDATLACAGTALLAGIVVGDLAMPTTLEAHAWLLLLALTAQVGSGVLLAVALPRLPAVSTSIILLVQPVLSVALGIIILSETPSVGQLAGVGLVIGGVVLGSLPSRPRWSRCPPRPPLPRLP
jgi:drug/metabolite transporter (DMT)-like permease